MDYSIDDASCSTINFETASIAERTAIRTSRIEYCVVLSVTVLCIVLGGGLLALISFDILALNHYSNSGIQELCEASLIWYYVLMSLIFTVVYGVSLSQDDHHGLKVCNNKSPICSITFTLLLCVYPLIFAL